MLSSAPNADWRSALRRLAALLSLAALLVFCWRVAEVRPLAIFDQGTLATLWSFLRGLFPPDLSPAFLRTVLHAAGQTIAIAVAGTALSILLGLPLGVLATGTLWRRGVLVERVGGTAGYFLLSNLSRATRAALGFLRAVPDLLWGILFVVAVGLGPMAGVLALAVSYGGVLGRVYADVFESVDPRPPEALHASGATRFQVFARAIWPQAAPSFTAYTLYSFECCVRAAAVLGFVGAGGIGYEIFLSMRLFEYGQVLTLLIALVVMLTAVDALSRRIRRGMRFGAPTHERPTLSPLRAFTFVGRRLPLPQKLSSLAVTTQRTAILLTFLVVGVSFYATGFRGFVPLDAGTLSRVARFVGALIPPELTPSFLAQLVVPLLQTVAISVVGTLLGVAVGAVLAIPAASNLVLSNVDEGGRRSAFVSGVRLLVHGTARLALNFLRAIPELLWVLVCILAFGLGPFAGTVAIGLHTGGVLGKLYAETLEEVPSRPVESLRAAGATPLQILVWGMVPLARPMLVSYTVLRWEMNLRVSTVLGLVGGGGLGMAIYNNVQLGFYSRVATLVLLVYLLVAFTDWLGERLRVSPVSVRLAARV